MGASVELDEHTSRRADSITNLPSRRAYGGRGAGSVDPRSPGSVPGSARRPRSAPGARDLGRHARTRASPPPSLAGWRVPSRPPSHNGGMVVGRGRGVGAGADRGGTEMKRLEVRSGGSWGSGMGRTGVGIWGGEEAATRGKEGI